jgi:hypothetical protein
MTRAIGSQAPGALRSVCGAAQRISRRTRPSVAVTGTHRRARPVRVVVVSTFFTGRSSLVVHRPFT